MWWRYKSEACPCLDTANDKLYLWSSFLHALGFSDVRIREKDWGEKCRVGLYDNCNNNVETEKN